MTTKEEALEAFLNGSPTHQERLRRGICVDVDSTLLADFRRCVADSGRSEAEIVNQLVSDWVSSLSE